MTERIDEMVGPAHDNQRALWDAGCRFDFDNPDHRWANTTASGNVRIDNSKD